MRVGLSAGAPADLFADRGNAFADLGALERPILAIVGGKQVV